MIDSESLHQLAHLARKAVEVYLFRGEKISPPFDLSKACLKETSGVFVTITKNGELRGCIGTFVPTKQNIAQETIANALSAALEDHRFQPLLKEELGKLEFEVSIIGELKQVFKIEDLNPEKYGLLVRDANEHSGLLLPGLEGITTANEQIAVACRKAGIDLTKEKIYLWIFETQKSSDQKENPLTE